MIEVSPALFVGDGADYAETAGKVNWAIVTAAKDPWHRAAVGYTTAGAPQGHPEYLWAHRDAGAWLILNMVDAADAKYFAPQMVNEALAFVWESLDSGMRVLIHCNEGHSRAPSLALLYLHGTDPDYDLPLAEAVERFKQIYPTYAPRAGIWGYVESHWQGQPA